MPYPRYNNSGSNSGYSSNQVPAPWSGGGGGMANPQMALASNLMGALLQGNMNMAGAMGGGGMGGGFAQPMQNWGGNSGGGYGRNDRRDNHRSRDSRSPGRSGYGRDNKRDHSRRNERSRSPHSNRGSRSSYSSNSRGGGSDSNRRNNDVPPKERPEHEIYIGNYPVRFGERELRQLFEKHGVKVGQIRHKHVGLKVFAFAEVSSKAEIQKAVDAMDGNEINGRILRVRSAGEDKDKKTASQEVKPATRRELHVDDVKRHLAFSFNEFLDREMKVDEITEDRHNHLQTAMESIKKAFDLPEDDSLKISRTLELIFMQNNRREIKPPEPVKKETTEAEGEKDEEKAENDEENAEEVNEEEQQPEEQNGDEEQQPEDEEMKEEVKTEEAAPELEADANGTASETAEVAAPSTPATPARGRGRGGARGTPRNRGRGGRGAKK